MAPDPTEILYPRAPILEAVVEIRFPEVSPQKVRKVAGSLKSRYAEQTEEILLEGSLDFASKAANFKELTPKFRLTSSDQTDAFHVTVGNIVWLRLAPYEGWDAFHSRIAQELPKVLKALGDPKTNRIGLRYINRIDFPMRDGLGYHEDYLSFRIFAGDILEPHNGFRWVIQKDFPDHDLSAIVQSGTQDPELPKYGAVNFDIDVYKVIDLPKKSDSILECLCHMRRLKNEIFEAGITDKARELFNEPRN